MIIIPTFTEEETSHWKVVSTTNFCLSASVFISQHPDQHVAHKRASRNIYYFL